MLFDESALSKLMRLARIECTEEEKARLLQSLPRVLSYIEQLQEVDTQGVEPCSHVLDHHVNIFREDLEEEPLSRALFLANAVHTGGMIKVPPIMKGEE